MDVDLDRADLERRLRQEPTMTPADSGFGSPPDRVDPPASQNTSLSRGVERAGEEKPSDKGSVAPGFARPGSLSVKGLEWEVGLRGGEFYYKERGASPEKALANLITALETGIALATENVAHQQRRLTALSEYHAALEAGVLTAPEHVSAEAT